MSHSPLVACVSALVCCTQIDLSFNDIGAEGAKPLADALRVTASLTKILVSWNSLGDEGTIILCDGLRASTISKVEELDLGGNGIGPEGAKAVAAMAAAMGSLTRLDVRWNNMDVEGKAALRKAIEGRSGFELLL